MKLEIIHNSYIEPDKFLTDLNFYFKDSKKGFIYLPCILLFLTINISHKRVNIHSLEKFQFFQKNF